MTSSSVITAIIMAARRLGIPPAIALGQAQVESNFSQGARGAAGEIGIFQIIPRWHERTARSMGLDIYTTEGNIAYGVALLASSIRAEGDVTKGLRRYNGGPAWHRKSQTAGYARRVLAAASRYGNVGKGGTAPTQGAGAWPVPGGKVISVWGDPRDGGARSHQGVDIAAPMGTPVVTFVAGTVTKVYTGKRSGISVQVRGADGRLYNYFHLQRANVKAGQKLSLGAALGTVGDTGNAKGTTPHLHFEIRDPRNVPMDPLPILKGSSVQGLAPTPGGVGAAEPGVVDVQEMIASLQEAEEQLTQSLAQHFEVDPEAVRPQVQGLASALVEQVEARSGQAVVRQEAANRMREEEGALRVDENLLTSLQTVSGMLGGGSGIEP